MSKHTAITTSEILILSNRAYDSASLASSSLAQLSALFRAIREAAKDDHHIQELCNLGQYLADDYKGLCDFELKGLDEQEALIVKGGVHHE